jgi:arginyl-tRNA synthetase
LLGKKLVEEGLEKGVFYAKEDKSVWVDLSDSGLDEKLLLRPDGTSVYITQDLGTAELKFTDFTADLSIYVVGDEQDYHFKVLELILQKMGKPYAEHIHQLSYGMVDLPEGKMKSREGKVVDADELMEEMYESAKAYLAESGKWDDLSREESDAISELVGLAAMKFYILKTQARKKMVFNPAESIDLQGFTGPFVQYTYARIRSVMRKGNISDPHNYVFKSDIELSSVEAEIIKSLYNFGMVLHQCSKELDTSMLAMYVYKLAKLYNQFYQDHQILKESNPDIRSFRIRLSMAVAEVISRSLGILGIGVPEKM